MDGEGAVARLESRAELQRRRADFGIGVEADSFGEGWSPEKR
jgi:hypothetical protein